MNAAAISVGGGVLATLVAATALGLVLSRAASSPEAKAWVENYNERTRAWCVIAAAVAASFALGGTGVVVLFAAVSFLALREFVTLLPTQRADHKALLWAFYVITPLQYFFVATGSDELFMLFIPVWAFVFIPVRVALCGDSARFLERTSEVQWGLMACVYSVSYAPALLTLDAGASEGRGSHLLLFLLLVVAASDVSQYVWGRLLGKHRLVPRISPNKTWEGLIGGILSASALGAALWWLTPFAVWQSALAGFGLAGLGFLGGLTMSAIKRDRGIKDFGSLVSGHGGVLDRIDSLCFAAPAFFFISRLSVEGGPFLF